MPVEITGSATDTNKSVVVWQLLTPSVTSSAVADGYPAINLIDPANWSSWLPSAVGGWARYDFGSAVSVDAIGIAAHQFGSNGTTVSVQSSSDGSTWTTRATSSPITDDDLILLIPAVSFRYWRILLTGAVSNVGVMVIGAKLAFPHVPVDSYIPLHHARRYEKMFNDSIKGVMLGNRVMAAGAETDVDFGFVARSFVDGPLRAFESHYNQGGTFFYAGWPEGQPLDMGYCRADSDNAIVSVEYIEGEGLANLSMGLKAYVG